MPNVKTSPNQRMVKVHRNLPQKGGNEPYLAIKTEHLFNAYRDLNATALVLYLYLANNADGYSFALSPQAIFNEIGMPTSTCSDQVKKLIEKGYLVAKEGSNLYDFYEVPQTIEEPKTKTANVDFLTSHGF